jgi:hypothetical protein
MKTSPLALAVLALSASWASADSNADRHRALAEKKPTILALCSSVETWPLQIFGGAEAAAEAGLIKEDDSRYLDPTWSEPTQSKVREAKRTIKNHCARLRNAKLGLSALTHKDAALDKIGGDLWDDLYGGVQDVAEIGGKYAAAVDKANAAADKASEKKKKKVEPNYTKAVYQVADEGPKDFPDIVDNLDDAIKAARPDLAKAGGKKR